MESELRALLSGVDDSVIGTLAKNDIRSLEDAKLLSVEDLKELGFSIGTRNRLLKLFSEAKSGYVRTAATSLASGIGASVKNLLLSGRGAGAASDLAKFKQVFNIGGQDATDKARRDRLYPCWDTNANGFLSLHEVDQGIKTRLIGELKNKPEAERIWRRFRRSYIARRPTSDARAASAPATTPGRPKTPMPRPQVPPAGAPMCMLPPGQQHQAWDVSPHGLGRQMPAATSRRRAGGGRAGHSSIEARPDSRRPREWAYARRVSCRWIPTIAQRRA